MSGISPNAPNTISRIEISDMCLESYPCQHDIKIDGIDQGTWGGVKIAKWFKDKASPIPDHFLGYEHMIKE